MKKQTKYIILIMIILFLFKKIYNFGLFTNTDELFNGLNSIYYKNNYGVNTVSVRKIPFLDLYTIKHLNAIFTKKSLEILRDIASDSILLLEKKENRYLVGAFSNESWVALKKVSSYYEITKNGLIYSIKLYKPKYKIEIINTKPALIIFNDIFNNYIDGVLIEGNAGVKDIYIINGFKIDPNENNVLDDIYSKEYNRKIIGIDPELIRIVSFGNYNYERFLEHSKKANDEYNKILNGN